MSGARAALALAAILGVAAPGLGATHLLVVSGLGGDEVYGEAFHRWSLAVLDGALEAGLPASDLAYLAAEPVRDSERIDGESRATVIASTLREMAARAGEDGELWLVMFGHGSTRGAEPTVNLPGPDLSGGELAALLDELRVKRVVVVNASSASGDFVRLLSGPGRAIVTATRSVTERHAPVFGGFFSEAFKDGGADVDKDRRVSLLEAFEYARAAVERSFAGDQRLATEHALLDDNGDGSGSMTPAREGDGDGVVASRLFLGAGSARAAALSPELARLALRKGELEDRVAELRGRKDSLDETLYLEELESLLLDLARTNAEIERLQGAEEGSG